MFCDFLANDSGSHDEIIPYSCLISLPLQDGPPLFVNSVLTL